MIHAHQQRNTKLYPLCYTEDIIVIQELGWVYNIKTIYQIYQPNILFYLIVEKKQFRLWIWSILIFEIIPNGFFQNRYRHLLALSGIPAPF